MNRRRLLLAAAAAHVPGARAHAADSLVIKPLSPTISAGTRYSRFANPGDIGLPAQPVRIEPQSGLKLFVWMPPGLREARVVVFSHGEFAPPSVYGRLLSHWASHGFAVLAPVHEDSVLENGLDARRRQAGNAAWDVATNQPEAWRSRARACRATLDALAVLERSSGTRLLLDRAIVAGHSLGAQTAQLLLGARALAPDGTVVEEADERFYGGLLLAPPGRGAYGLADGSWETMSRPFLLATGTGDGGQAAAVKAEAFAFAPPANKHLAWFSRITPASYSGQMARPGTAEERTFQDLAAVTTAFLVSYVMHDAEAFAELAGDYYTRMSDRRLDMRYR